MAPQRKRIQLVAAMVSFLMMAVVVSYGQNDACKTINHGTACALPGAGCDAGSGPGSGRCVNQTGDLRCDCVSIKNPSYSLSLSPLAPASVSPGGSATSTVTISPLAGYNSSVTLSCVVSGGGTPAPSCRFGTNPINGGSGTSTLTVESFNQTPTGAYSISVSGSDGSGVGPSNGAQSVTLTVQNGGGGGALALFTFATLLSLWGVVGVLRRRTIVQ
jgi:hypothetical protein